MHQENSKVLSIVIPVFNEIKFLNKLFDQIEKYFNKKDIEIIVVDDGSDPVCNRQHSTVHKLLPHHCLDSLIGLYIHRSLRHKGA